ncbi:MAG: metallopeptidase TldD-related protein [Elusimicrobiales bacterium]
MKQLLCAVLLALPARPALCGGDILNAMSKELDRSLSAYGKAEDAPLYFLSYQMTDDRRWSLSAELGGINQDDMSHERYLDIDARVGSPELDNTHQVKGAAAMSGDHGDEGRHFLAPLEDDETALRASLWRQTEEEFKKAQEKYTKVKTNHAVTADEEDGSPDFSQEKPEKSFREVEFPKLDRPQWRARLERLSREMRRYPFIYSTDVNFSVSAQNRYYVNSEGSRIASGNVYITLGYRLGSRTDDGMELERYKSYEGLSEQDFPSEARVIADIAASAAELKALLDAPVAEPYSGPAILRNRAAAVFFHEIFGHRVEGQRQKDEFSGKTFADKVGGEIVSPLISVADDPTLKRFNGLALRGWYDYDDEGVRARRVEIAENGVLRAFLMSRSPINGFPQSNGHGRREPGYDAVARMGNTIVSAKAAVPYPRLREMLIEEIKRRGKPYGLVFEDIAGGNTNTSVFGAQAFTVIPKLVYRVYADGSPDEAVRGVDLIGTPLTVFTKITAAADDPAVFNGSCGAESGWVPVSAVSPSLLVSEMEVQKVVKMHERPPLIPPPSAEAQ